MIIMRTNYITFVQWLLNIKKTKIIASGAITWQIEGEKVEAVTDLIFLGFKITAAMKLKDACSLEGELWQT